MLRAGFLSGLARVVVMVNFQERINCLVLLFVILDFFQTTFETVCLKTRYHLRYSSTWLTSVDHQCQIDECKVVV